MIQDLKGNLSVVSPRESHQSEETLPPQPLGQFTLKGVTVPAKLALLMTGPIHPPKVKYSLLQTITQ